MPKATRLECSLCKQTYPADQVANLCTCGGPLLVRFDLDTLRHRWPRRAVASGPASMWRYAPILPPADASIFTLGEGWTPLVRTKRLGARIGADSLWVKDEGLNPTGSFKARGLSCAVSMCAELGEKKVAIPSAGNAASAMAAYAAAAGIEAHIFIARDLRPATPPTPTHPARPPPVSRLIFSCRATFPRPISWSAKPMARASPWSMAP